jgi:lipid-A-disaccharide synthase
MDGLIGLILALPGLRLLKRRLVPRLLAKVPFVSLPNRIAGIPIVPELRGHVTPAGVARAASTLLDDPEKLALIRSALRRFADRGAAERVAERLLEP